MNKKREKKTFFIIISMAIMPVITILFFRIAFSSTFFTYPADAGITIETTLDLFRKFPKGIFVLSFFGFYIIFVLLYMVIRKVDTKWYQVLYKYRYVCVGAILVIVVCLELSGSSISYFSQFFAGMDDTNTIFRTYNPLRSDEFAVNTVYAISQEANNYQYFSDIVRGTTTDMFIVYGQPVWDYGIFFRPFQIGYLLLGSSRGLSFFWCSRLLALFMVTFEFGRLILNDKKKLSLCFAMLITLAPVTQWWFAINGLVEQLVFGQLCVLLLDKYMKSDSIRKRILYVISFFWAGGCFALVFYPAWQIPFGYIFLALMIWIILKNRKQFVWNGKKDILIIALVVVVWIFLMTGILIRSWETILSVMSTAYPGQRISTEKLTLREMFSYVYNIFLPMVDTGTKVIWSFLDLFPMGILLALYGLGIKKKKDLFLTIILALDVIFLLIYILPIPEIILKMTLLSMVPASRVVVPLGFLNSLLIFRAVIVVASEITLKKCVIVSGIYAIIILIITRNMVLNIGIPFSRSMQVIVLFVFGILLLLFLRYRTKNDMLIISLVIVLAFAGGLVNPVQRGIDFIEDDKVITSIKNIVEQDNGKWIVEGGGFPVMNLPLIAGAPTINCTNTYPDLERWKKLDPEEDYEEIYNRYAHIQMNLTETENTTFNLLYSDSFQVILNVDDMEKISVKHILSQNNLESLSNENVDIVKVSDEEGWKIYDVNYK